MKLQSIVDAWNAFFFAPQSPLPICVFRILFGILVTATLLLLHGDWLSWYGTHSWVSLATMQQVEPGTRLNIFTVLPPNDRYIEALFWTFLTAAIFLTVGLFTRLSTVVVFLCLTSIQQRNLYITHSGDTLLRVIAFFLIFAPAGAALSIDRSIRIRRGKEGLELQARSPWAQRMIQLELSFLYVTAFWWKSLGDSWVNGTALYYVLHLDEIGRFPLPQWVTQSFFIKIGTWFTLALELALGTLIWIREFRYPLLLVGLLFHLSLEYALNVPLFQWEILSIYILFVRPEDIVKAGQWIARRLPLRQRRALLGQR
jgi:hypothetical protein